MIIYAVYASDYESSWIKKAFVSKEKAEAYAQEIRAGMVALNKLMPEYNRREDEIYQLIYDQNGLNGEPLFEKLAEWCSEQRDLLNIHEDCYYGIENIFVKELEVEE